MTPEIERALRLDPRLQKRLRERRAALLAALDEGTAEAISEAAAAWATAEREAERDVAAKRPDAPKHRVSFLVEETYYRDFLKTATEHKLSPSEVARRYCVSGYRFSDVVWQAIRKGTLSDWINTTRPGLNLAEFVLPDFSRERPVGIG